ncbi:MAG: hypothetical protein NT062_18180 [Proteobacteria bacterium]|nr:hypothetical protein [Pseudomonadota bacterium]
MSEKRRAFETKAIRGFVLFLAGLALLSMIAGLFPGISKYEHGALVEIRAPGGWSYVGFVLAAALPAILVWRRPRPMMLFAWSAFVWIFGIVVFAITFELNFDWGDFTYVQHVAQYVFDWTAAPLGILVFFVIPPVAALYAIVTRVLDHRARLAALPPPPPTLPVARVVR